MLRSSFLAIWLSVATGLVEALVLWLILGNPQQLSEVFVVTVAGFMVAVAADTFRPDELSADQVGLAAIGLVLTVVFFGTVIAMIGKHAESGKDGWIAAQYGTLILLAVPSYGLREYLRRLSK